MLITQRPGRLPIIATPRLIMRDITETDICSEYLAWLNEPETNRFLEIRHLPQTLEMVRCYVQDMLSDTVSAKHFGIYEKENARLVGTVTLPVINVIHGFAEISFVVGAAEARGKGYGSEAVHAVCWYMFRVEGLHKLIAGYYSSNIGSQRLLERLGFVEEARLREKLVDYQGKRVDHILVGLLAQEFKITHP